MLCNGKGDSKGEAVSLLKRAFTDAEIIEHYSKSTETTQDSNEQLNIILNNSNKKLFIQEFPLSFDQANEYEQKTNGINLFINFTGNFLNC